MTSLGKLLILIGLLFIAVGVGFGLVSRLPWLGRLPGDILIQKGRLTFFFPLATSIVLSLLLTLIFNLFFRR